MQCCGRFPPTGAHTPFVTRQGALFMACPLLAADGRCGSYHDRPQGCRDYYCAGYSNTGWRPR